MTRVVALLLMPLHALLACDDELGEADWPLPEVAAFAQEAQPVLGARCATPPAPGESGLVRSSERSTSGATKANTRTRIRRSSASESGRSRCSCRWSSAACTGSSR